MDCLDDNAVIGYVERILPEPERLRIATHLDECAACLAITCAVARSIPRGRTPAPPAKPERLLDALEAAARPRHRGRIASLVAGIVVAVASVGAVVLARDTAPGSTAAPAATRATPPATPPTPSSRMSRGDPGAA